MNVWIYIIVIIVYLIMNAVKKGEKVSNPDEEGKNNNDESNPDKNVIHTKGKVESGDLRADYERDKKDRHSERKSGNSQKPQKQRSETLEGKSFDEIFESLGRQRKTEVEKNKEFHYSEEELVQDYETKHKSGKQITHHKHPELEKEGVMEAYNYDAKKVHKTNLGDLIKNQHDIRKAYLVTLLLETKFDKEE